MTLALERLTPELLTRVSQVAGLMEAAYAGDYKARFLLAQEAFTTSDFPQVFQIINNATVASLFTKEAPGLWPKVSKRTLLDSVNKPTNLKSFDLDMSNLPAEQAGIKRLQGALPNIAELDIYPAIGFQTSQSGIAVGKVGARIGFSWEAWREDDYSVIEGLPQGLVIAAKRTEDLKTFNVLFNASGWNQASFPNGDPAYLAGNPALTLNSLGAAIAQASSVPAAYDPDKLRVNTITKWALLVPRALEQQANTIVRATNIIATGADGTKYETPNLVAGQVEVVAVPYIDTLSAGYANRNTMWGLVPIGGNGADRPSIVTTFLRGNETPELRIKADTGNLLGGGALDGFAGSFDADDVQIRIRYFVDAYLQDKVGFALSNGSGVA
jgi:hypothetical protein